MNALTRIAFAAASFAMVVCAASAAPLHLGFTEIPSSGQRVTTIFYPTPANETPQRRGPFSLSWAPYGPLAATTNGRLIVISHGSGAAPWVSADLARALVGRGFVVALPQHQGDNHLDHSTPGPESRKRRPQEISQAIDAVLTLPVFAGKLHPEVGVFGGSAGGHAALSMAGGVWSPARLKAHCAAHLDADFSSCVGFITRLNGNWLDGPKRWLARTVINARFNDSTPQSHHDARVKAVVAMVPYAADFDRASLTVPRVTLGLITAGKDVNQIPRFHIEAVKQACLPRCCEVLNLPGAGHGAMLSPLPPLQSGSIEHQLLADPTGFDRKTSLPILHRAIADFFVHHLTTPKETP